MNLFDKYKWLSWVVLFLLILNIAALGSIIYFFHMKPERFGHFYSARAGNLNEMNKENYIMQELNLTPAQKQSYKSLKDSFFNRTAPYFKSIRSTKAEIFRILSAESPDTLKLDSLAKEMGLLHGGLQQQSARHFMQIRELCNPQQKEKLSVLYRELFIRGPMDEGRNMQHRHGWGQGRGGKDRCLDENINKDTLK